MIVYSSTKSKFKEDVSTNDIGNIIYESYRLTTGRNTGKSEIDSWTNSLQYMDRVLNDDDIPHDAGVSIEYHLPQSSKRIDFILTGKDQLRRDSVILIELKQWQQAQLTDSDAIVITQFKHGLREALHPSYQAWSYKCLLEDFNATVQEEQINLFPCAYLHNYEDDGIINNDFYSEHISRAPIFFKRDAYKLQEFIKKNVKYGDDEHIMYRIDHGKIRPSKNLADQLLSMLKGNEEFVLIDDQKIVFETALRRAIKFSGKKNVLVVDGGPGTGKSVVAINLLVALTDRGLVAKYITRNSAPRLVYEAKLTGSFKKSHISSMFSGSGSYHTAKENSFDCLIVDEAHRLNEKSGMFNHLGENQVKELINASKLCVFFIDEDQKVTLKDIGNKDEIRRWAKELNATVTELSLESQFRCNGSNGYLAWLDNTLQIRKTANEILETKDYDFRILNSPGELHDLIREKNRPKNKARMVAGYCWKWISKKHPHLKDITIGQYKATWNLNSDGQAWIIKPESVSEVGCIHTSQGLEVDYIGVIVGPDLIAREMQVITQPNERASTDKSIFGWKTLARKDPEGTAAQLDSIIKNTYRTLMTRGQKGCYVYFVDDETKQFFESRISKSFIVEESAPRGAGQEMPATCPFRLVQHNDIKPFENCVPLYDLRTATELFRHEEQPMENIYWVELPDVFRPRPGLFVAQVVGESMNRRIPNNSWCLFNMHPAGSCQGKTVLAQHGKINDPDTGGSYTVKVYESIKKPVSDEIWRQTSIILRPDSTSLGCEKIELSEEQVKDLKIIAELVAVLG